MIDGVTNGTFKWYFENGMLRVVAEYVNGKRNGKQIYFTIKGDIQSESMWKNGEMLPMNKEVIVKPVTKTEVAKADTLIKKYTADTCISGDCKNGFGTLVYSTGESYTGNWVNGTMSGKGKFTSPNGNVFEGDFKNNSLSGKGILRMANGDVYNGDWENSEKQGNGKYIWANGEVYDGQWVNSKRQGKGKFIDKYGFIKDGNWVNNAFVITEEQTELNRHTNTLISALYESIEKAR
jgi:hypothetical protein